MKKEGNNKERHFAKAGITLISLVITIILMLILAGVAITLAIDSNGLFARAGQAANAWNESVANEREAIDELLNYMNTVGGGSQGGSGNLPEGWDSSKVTAVVEEGDRKAPIPNGYVASDVTGETSIADGLVIYEGTEKVSTDADAMTTRDQYVWIPVDEINSMVMCRTHGASVTLDPDTLQCPECGETTKFAGKTYDVTSSSTTVDGKKVYTYTQDFNQNSQTYLPNSGEREPAVVTGSSNGQGSQSDGDTTKNYHGLGSATAFLEQLESDFEEMARSVAKYKGFYVSRYEIGAGASSKQEQTVLNSGKNGTNSDYMWYGLYNVCRNVTDSTMHSHMIWGSQYDQIMKFAKEKERRDGTGEVFDVFIATVERQKKSPSQAGTNSADKVCNIYDLEGNYSEYTTQASSIYYRVKRGGNYSTVQLGNFYPAGYFAFYNPTIGNSSISSRATLYVAL